MKASRCMALESGVSRVTDEPPEKTSTRAANDRICRSNLEALEVRDRFSDFSSAVVVPGACSCIPTIAVSHVAWQ